MQTLQLELNEILAHLFQLFLGLCLFSFPFLNILPRTSAVFETRTVGRD